MSERTWLTFWPDALFCKLVPRAARWTAVVVDRVDGAEHWMPAVRFRSQRSIDRWVRNVATTYVRRGMTVRIEARPIPRAWTVVLVGEESGTVTSLDFLEFASQDAALTWVMDMHSRSSSPAHFEVRAIP